MSSVHYVYADESGKNDGTGDALHIGIVIVHSSLRTEMQKRLGAAEQKLNKKSKWHGTSVKTKTEYLRSVLNPGSGEHLYWSRKEEALDYGEATAVAVASAIKSMMEEESQFIVIIDALKKACRQQVAKILRSHNIRWREIQVEKREESDALLRLADAIAGFARDFHREKDFAVTLWPAVSRVITEV